MKLKLLVVAALLASTVLISVTAQINPYDPWLDYDDDGDIDIFDVVQLTTRYGSEGTPINKSLLMQAPQTLHYTVDMETELDVAATGITPWTVASPVLEWTPTQMENAVLDVQWWVTYTCNVTTVPWDTRLTFALNATATGGYAATKEQHVTGNFSIGRTVVVQGPSVPVNSAEYQWQFVVRGQSSTEPYHCTINGIRLLITVVDGLPAP